VHEKCPNKKERGKRKEQQYKGLQTRSKLAKKEGGAGGKNITPLFAENKR